MQKENFFKKHRDKIIIGVFIAVVGSIIFALISGVGNAIYTWIFDDRKIEISLQNNFLVGTSQLPTSNLSIQGYRLDNIATTTVKLLEKIRLEH